VTALGFAKWIRRDGRLSVAEAFRERIATTPNPKKRLQSGRKTRITPNLPKKQWFISQSA